MTKMEKKKVCVWMQADIEREKMFYMLLDRLGYRCVVSRIDKEEMSTAIENGSRCDTIVIDSCDHYEALAFVTRMHNDLCRKPLLVVDYGNSLKHLADFAWKEHWSMVFLSPTLMYEELRTKLYRSLLYADALAEGKIPTPYSEEMIVMTDDVAANLLLLGVLLKCHKFKTYAAERENTTHRCNDEELMEYLEKEPVRLLMSSGHRNGAMDGFELIKTVNEKRPGTAPACMMIAAYDMYEAFVHAYRCGAIDYLLVPFERQELVLKLRSHLEMSSVIGNAVLPAEPFKLRMSSNKKKMCIMGAEYENVDELLECARNMTPKVGDKKNVTVGDDGVAYGVYVADVSELYPCFDSEDFATETRRYHNFVFAHSKEELQTKVELLRKVPAHGNYCKVHEETPAEVHPLIYWQGDSNDPLLYQDVYKKK